jgi:hypothetical protein
VHLFVDAVQRIHVEQAAPDARLVGGDHHAVAALVELGDGFQTARNRLPLRRVLDELGGIEVDDAVAVEDDEFHAESLEMSATWFIASVQGGQQAEPVGAQGRVFGIDHDVVEEAVDRLAQGGQACSEPV